MPPLSPLESWLLVLAAAAVAYGGRRLIRDLAEAGHRKLSDRRIRVRRGRPDDSIPRRVASLELDLVDRDALPWLSGDVVTTSTRCAPREAARTTTGRRAAA